MALPVFTTIEDVRAIIAYLKNKPTGATIAEAKAAVKKQLLDGRKVSAYKFWDITAKDNDRLKLSKRGWEIARQTNPRASFSWISLIRYPRIVPFSNGLSTRNSKHSVLSMWRLTGTNTTEMLVEQGLMRP